MKHKFCYALKIGFFGGLLWGLAYYLANLFSFTKGSPLFLIQPFVSSLWLKGMRGFACGLLAFICMSVLAAILYMFLFRNFLGPWLGLLFGIVWWIIFYVGIAGRLNMIRVSVVGWDSILSDFCLFMLWGLFIGYSISFEFNEKLVSTAFYKADEDS